MENFVLSLASQHPLVATIIMAIGGLRVLIKPMMTILHQEAAQLNAPKLEAGVTAVENSKAYSILLYVLDWFGSVKLQPTVTVDKANAAIAQAAQSK